MVRQLSGTMKRHVAGCHTIKFSSISLSEIVISNSTTVFSLVYFPLFNNLPLFNLMNQDNDDIFNDIDPEVNHFAEIFPGLNDSEHSDYYSIDKFNENSVTNVNDLNIIHCNIRSLYAHHDEFLSLLSILWVKFHILCFSESWLTDATKQLINFQGYQSFHSLRPINKRVGGIAYL